MSPEKRYQLDEPMAEVLISLPFKCVFNEWPNKLNQVLGSASEIDLPSVLHPSFYGCFDWHSAVHAHWTMLRLLRAFPDKGREFEVKKVFDQHITKEKIDKEIEYFLRPSEKAFERPYGWAWLLKLGEELLLHGQSDPFWKDKHDIIQNFTSLITDRYIEFIPKLTYPVRSGEHSNTAFGLLLAWDFALTSDNQELKHLIKEHSIRLFSSDINCPIGWEPGGFDFLSPCLVEALLMKRILNEEEYKKWLINFLPQMYEPTFNINTAMILDRKDGKLVHLDGYNFIVAYCLHGISEDNVKLPHLSSIANRLITDTLHKIIDGQYAGEHWLASFAVLAILG